MHSGDCPKQKNRATESTKNQVGKTMCEDIPIIHISEYNRKLKATAKYNGCQCIAFDLPAGPKTKKANGTCPYAGLCTGDCYACSGKYVFHNEIYENNRLASLGSDFVYRMTGILTDYVHRVKPGVKTYLRLHTSGDFYGRGYVKKWIDIAYECPTVNIYAYTKSIPFFKGVDLPPNFKVVYSYGGKKDDMIDMDNDTVALVYPSVDMAIKAGCDVTCNYDDLAMFEHRKLGLVYHGYRAFEKTTWAAAPWLKD